MRKVLFWTNCNKEIGAGHLNRCVILADRLKVEGFDIEFAMLKGKDYIPGAGNYKNNFIIHSVNYESDIFALTGYDYLIIDTYSLKESHLSKARKNFKHIIVIDDLNNLDYYNVDLVINGDYQAKSWKYSCSGKTLLGIEYLLIGPEFVPNYKAKKDYILVLTGATNDTLVERMQNLICDKANDLEYKIITPNLSKYKAKKPIYELMQSAVLVVTAGGMSMYEAMACNAPVIGYVIADNQRPAVEALAASKLIAYAQDIEDIPSMITHNPAFNLFNGYTVPKIIDNLGAQRIVDEIEALS